MIHGGILRLVTGMLSAGSLQTCPVVGAIMTCDILMKNYMGHI